MSFGWPLVLWGWQIFFFAQVRSQGDYPPADSGGREEREKQNHLHLLFLALLGQWP